MHTFVRPSFRICGNIIRAASAGLLLGTAPAMAEEKAKDANQEAKDALELALKREELRLKQEEVRTAQIENAKNEQAAQDKLIAALGLPEGKTELGKGAGAFEANLFTAAAADQIAGNIATQVKTKVTQTVILIAHDEPLNFDVRDAFLARMDGLQRLLKQPAGCPAPGLSKEQFQAFLREQKKQGARIGLMGADKTTKETVDATDNAKSLSTETIATFVAGLLRNDTKLDTIEVSPDPPLLVTAVGHHLKKAPATAEVVIPSQRVELTSVLLDPDNVALESFAAVSDGWEKLKACIAAVKPGANEKDPTLVRLQALEASTAATMAAVTTPNVQGRVELAEAISQAKIADGLKDARILRIRTHSAGGSALQTKNLMTLVGFAGMKVAGGLVASWTLTNPSTGALLAANTHYASCGLKRVGDAHRGKLVCNGASERPEAPVAKGKST